MDNRQIGVFDSGVGGMTVLKELMQLLPSESFIYLGDTKRFPYGSKSKQTIIDLTKNGIEFLMGKNVKMIVIACGTATSQALKEVKQVYDIPIIGVIEPTIQYLKQKKERQIGVMATAGTIKSKGWEQAIIKAIPQSKVQGVSCPLLAPMVEEGWYNNDIARLVIKEYLKQFNNIETLILGCTHYPLLQNVIEKELNAKINIVNIGVHVATKVQEELKFLKLEASNKAPTLDIYLTDTETKFNQVASNLLGIKIQSKQAKHL